jgi:hypothetical protein
MFGDANYPLVYRIGDSAPAILKQVLEECGILCLFRLDSIQRWRN